MQTKYIFLILMLIILGFVVLSCNCNENFKNKMLEIAPCTDDKNICDQQREMTKLLVTAQEQASYDSLK